MIKYYGITTLYNRLVLPSVLGRGDMIDFPEGFVEVAEVVESAVAADSFDGYVGNGQLFGGEVHAQGGDEIAQRFIVVFAHHAVYMIDISAAAFCKAPGTLTE